MKSLVCYDTIEFNTTVLTENYELVGDNLFVPCTGLKVHSIGFGKSALGNYIEEVNGVRILTVISQEKKPKKSHVDYLVDQRIATLEEEEMRAPTSCEKRAFKEDAILSLIPETFPDTPVTVSVMFYQGLMFLDTTPPRAEAVISFLRELIGSITAVPVSITGITQKLNDFVLSGAPEPFELGEKISLIGDQQLNYNVSGGSFNDNITALLSGSGSTKSLELSYDTSIHGFVLKDNLTITGVRYDSSFLCEVKKDEAGSFLLKHRALIDMYRRLLDELGYVLIANRPDDWENEVPELPSSPNPYEDG